jgi:DNA-binding NtrC family response regulator
MITFRESVNGESNVTGSTEREGGASLMARIVREKVTILIADDDPTMLQLTAMILSRSGYKVVTAEDGEAALKTFKEAPRAIQLVISDVVMPGMRGPQLVRSIKSLSPSTATLLMSGTRPLPSEAGCAAIAKPFRRETLVAKVHDLLAACDFGKIEREQSIVRSERLAAIAAVQQAAAAQAGSDRSDGVAHSEELRPENSDGRE